MKIKKITWSVDQVAAKSGRFCFTLYGVGMQMRMSRDLSAAEMSRALGAMHRKGFVVLPQD